jgi:outer membrane protein assembly factor BamB/serine/threonine protein kinase
VAEQQEQRGQIVGEYRLLRKLGGGSFGQVYLAEHVRDHQQVALKLLQVHLTTKEDLRAFLNEARTMRLRHPHIVPLLDFGLSSEDMPFLVMEYASRGTLRNLHPKGSRIPLPMVVIYATQIASALQYAHDTHVIHRDVKPENMLVRDEQTILLSDFGIATTAHSTRSVRANDGVGGTVPYMAPEQLDGHPRPASDQYALGIVVYEWLAGRCPFQGTAIEVSMQHALKPPPSLVDQVPGLPKEVEEVIFKALAKDPKERFVSMQVFASTLQRASHATTLHKFVPPVQPEETLAPTIPPATPFPPPAVTRPSVVQEHVTQSWLPGTELPVFREGKSSARFYQGSDQDSGLFSERERESFSFDPSFWSVPVTTETKVSAPSSERKRGLSKWHVGLLLVMILLLIGGGSYAYSAVSTATMQAQVAATATMIQARASATAQAVASPYNAHVAKYGVGFGFDAQHTNYNPYEQLLNSTNVSHVQQKWATPTHASIDTSPAVVNGLIYVVSVDRSNHRKLYAFDAQTGQQRWVALAGNTIYSSSPAVANGVVYVGFDDNKLHAVDALTGQQKWAASTGNYVQSSPAVANGLVYVGSNDNWLHAFDEQTGKEKWKALTHNHIVSSPAVANGLVYVSSIDQHLYAFDAMTGQKKWETLIVSTYISSPAVVNGLVYVSTDNGKLHAFDAQTGQQKWEAPIGSGTTSPPAIANGLVYVSSDHGKLYAFDAQTGQKKWEVDAGGGSAPLTVANGLLYVSSDKLYALDAQTGQKKWAVLPGGGVSSSPAVANGFVYVGSDDGNLYAFSLSGNGS